MVGTYLDDRSPAVVISFLIDVFADAHAEFMAEARAQERADLMLKHASLMRALDALSEQIDLSPTESEILWDEQMEALHTTAVLLAKDFLAKVREAEEKIIGNGFITDNGPTTSEEIH